MTTTTKNPTALRFFFNGLKVGTGRLQRGNWSLIERWTTGAGREIQTQLVLYAKNYASFSAEVREELEVVNNSDSMIDYFETDRVSILPGHPLFVDAAAAYEKDLNRDIARCINKGDLDAAGRYSSDLVKLLDLVDAAK